MAQAKKSLAITQAHFFSNFLPEKILGYLKEFLRKKLKSAKKVTKLPALTVPFEKLWFRFRLMKVPVAVPLVKKLRFLRFRFHNTDFLKEEISPTLKKCISLQEAKPRSTASCQRKNQNYHYLILCEYEQMNVGGGGRGGEWREYATVVLVSLRSTRYILKQAIP